MNPPPAALLERDTPLDFAMPDFGAPDDKTIPPEAPHLEAVTVRPPPKPLVRAPVQPPAPTVALPSVQTNTVTASVDARKICFLLPQYKTTNPLTLFSLLANWDRAECGLIMHYGDALIVHTRNSLATKFVRSKFEWALFIDDDMVLPTGDPAWFRRVTGWSNHPDALGSQKTLPRLLSHGTTLVGGLYYGRGQGGSGKPMFAQGFREKSAAASSRNLNPPRGLLPTEWVGTGCTLIHRTVFEAIEKRFPHLAPSEPGGDWNYFSPLADQSMDALRQIAQCSTLEEAQEIARNGLSVAATVNARSGEDIVFCRRAAAAGHQPHVDLGLICGHVGSEVFGPSNTKG